MGPCGYALCPRREVVPWWERFCRVEYCKGGCDHGEDDQTAREVGTSQYHLGQSNSDFDFLHVPSARTNLGHKAERTHEIPGLLLVRTVLLLLQGLLFDKGRTYGVLEFAWWCTSWPERTSQWRPRSGRHLDTLAIS